MDIKDTMNTLAEQTRKNNLLNDVSLYLKHLANVVPQITAPEANRESAEFKNACVFAHSVHDVITKNLAEVKALVPTISNTETVDQDGNATKATVV